MDWQVVTTFLYVLLAFGFLLLLVLLLWIIRYRRLAKWQERQEAERRRLQLDLRKIDRDLGELRTELAPYTRCDSEPYRPILQELQQKLAWIQAEHVEQARQLEALPGRPFQEPDDPMARLWAPLGAEYRFWRERARTYGRIRRSGQVLEEEMRRARLLCEQLRALPLQAAEQAKQLRQDIRGALESAYALITTDGRAHSLSGIAGSLEKVQAQLQMLPGYFFESSPQLILQHARPEDVSRAWAILQKLKPLAGEQLAAYETWQQRYKQVDQAFRKLGQQMAGARRQFAAVDGSINISMLTAKLEQAGNRAHHLAGMYLAGTIHSSAQFSKEMSGIGKMVEWAAARAKAIQQEFTQLVQLFRELHQLLPRLEARVREESQAKNYAEWEPFQTRLAELRKAEAGIGELKSGWTPDRLTEHRERVGRVYGAASDLERRVREAQACAPKLKELLADPIWASSNRWPERLQNVQNTLAGYRKPGLSTSYPLARLKNEIDGLIGRREKTLAAYTAEKRIPVDRLKPESVEELRGLIKELNDFQARLDTLEQRVTSLKEKQRTKLQELEGMRQAINQLGNRWAELEFLGELTVSRQYNTWTNWVQHSFGKLVFEPGRRGPGPGRTASEIDKWAKNCLKELDTLLKALQGETVNAEKALNLEINRLEDKARLDKEPAVDKARKLLGQKRSRRIPRTGKMPKGRSNQVIHLIQQVAGRQLDDLKQLHEARAQLRAEIIDPMSESLDRLEQLQQQISVQLGQLQELKQIPEADPSVLDQLIRRAEKALDPRSRKQKALRSARTMGDVSGHLRDVIEEYERLAAELDGVIQPMAEKLPS